MVLRLIGSGTTDSRGIAILEKDADGEPLDPTGYTGTGRGEMDIVARCTIDEDTLQSEPYIVYDCTFKDIGTSSDYGNWTSTDFTGTKIERNSEYTTLIPEDTWDTQNKTITDDDLCIEFDINMTFSSAFYFIRFMGNGNNVTSFGQTELGLTSGTWSHVKLSRVENSLNIVVDGVSKTPLSVSASLDNFRILLDNSKCTNMKYKNLVIYPI